MTRYPAKTLTFLPLQLNADTVRIGLRFEIHRCLPSHIERASEQFCSRTNTPRKLKKHEFVQCSTIWNHTEQVRNYYA